MVAQLGPEDTFAELLYRGLPVGLQSPVQDFKSEGALPRFQALYKPPMTVHVIGPDRHTLPGQVICQTCLVVFACCEEKL